MTFTQTNKPLEWIKFYPNAYMQVWKKLIEKLASNVQHYTATQDSWSVGHMSLWLARQAQLISDYIDPYVTNYGLINWKMES